VQGLVVVNHREEDVHWSLALPPLLAGSDNRAEVSSQPELSMFGQRQ
jgi:hypothetical protein